MRQLEEETLALAGTIAAVLIGSLAFVTLTMPFVFPFVVVAAVAYLWRRGSKAAPRGPVAGPRPRVTPLPGRTGSRPLAA
jgi:hypothetical protein